MAQQINENENLQNTNEVENDGMDQDYLDTIMQMKQNTVPKDQYLKLKEENKKLLNHVMSNTPLDSQEN